MKGEKNSLTFNYRACLDLTSEDTSRLFEKWNLKDVFADEAQARWGIAEFVSGLQVKRDDVTQICLGRVLFEKPDRDGASLIYEAEIPVTPDLLKKHARIMASYKKTPSLDGIDAVLGDDSLAMGTVSICAPEDDGSILAKSEGSALDYYRRFGSGSSSDDIAYQVAIDFSLRRDDVDSFFGHICEHRLSADEVREVRFNLTGRRHSPDGPVAGV
jgi:uncharacterized protein YehS (DUF1456 family)